MPTRARTTTTTNKFEDELSGAFSLLTVDRDKSKVRTSDLGKLLLALGATGVERWSAYEKMVDPNNTSFFTREQVAQALQKLREQGRFPSLDELRKQSDAEDVAAAAKKESFHQRISDCSKKSRDDISSAAVDGFIDDARNNNEYNKDNNDGATGNGSESTREKEFLEAAHGSSKKILVVDDIGLCRRITSNQLEQLGFKDSPQVESGKEAIKYIFDEEKKDEVQCILLDIMMPQQNGVATLAKIREKEKKIREQSGHGKDEPIKVIAVTALNRGELLTLCESIEGTPGGVMFDGYIEKPATLTKIRDAMETTSIMFASSLPTTGTVNKRITPNRKNTTNNSAGSDPTTDEGSSGGSGGRGGSNEGTSTPEKDNLATSSDEKGQTTQVKNTGVVTKNKNNSKGNKNNIITTNNKEVDNMDGKKRAASPSPLPCGLGPTSSGETTSAAPDDKERYGSNERNVTGEKSRRSERAKRNKSCTRHSHQESLEENATAPVKDDARIQEKDNNSGGQQGSGGVLERNPDDTGSREGSGGGSGNDGSGGSGTETTLNLQLTKAEKEDIPKDENTQKKSNAVKIKKEDEEMAVNDDENTATDAGGDSLMAPTAGASAGTNVPATTSKQIEKEQQNQTGREFNTHRQCPRCNSNETRFCYYNNGLLSQPRHYCRSCQRYWTEGGTQRNLPKGSGRRKDRGAHAHDSGTNARMADATNAPSNVAAAGNPPFMWTNVVPLGGQRYPIVLPTNLVGIQPTSVGNASTFSLTQAAAAAAAAGGGFNSVQGFQGGTDPTNSEAHVGQILSSVAGYDVNLAASLVGYAASRIGEEIARNAKIIHGESPGVDVSERIVTLAKITGWRIGTAVSTIAMSSVEQGMLQADVNALVQAQVPAIASQATIEANAILQTMTSTTNITGSVPATGNVKQQSTAMPNNQNVTINDNDKNKNSSSNKSKKGSGSGNSGGSGGTGLEVGSMGNNTAQVTSVPEAALLAMQQAHQTAIARWMNELQSQQAAIMPGVLNPFTTAASLPFDAANASKTSQAAMYSNLLMGLAGDVSGGGVDAKAKEVKR